MSLSISNPFNISYYISILSSLASIFYILSYAYLSLLNLQLPLFIINYSILFTAITTVLLAIIIMVSSKDFKDRYKKSRVSGFFNIFALIVFIFDFT